MLMDDAVRLRKQWLKNDNPPCKPKKRVKEYFTLGEDTGNEVCIQCGQTFSRYSTPSVHGNNLT